MVGALLVWMGNGRESVVKRRRMALMVMVDALGGRFLREHDFLPELEYRASLRTVLGFSCACQPTLLSGKMPAEHGHGAMYMRRDGHSVLDAAKPFDRLPSFLADNHRGRSRSHGRGQRDRGLPGSAAARDQ